MTRNRWIIFIGIIIAIFAGLVWISKTKDNTTTNSSGSNNVYGKLDSPVTFTEFVDFQCEACYVYYPTVKDIKEKYQDKVRFEVRYFPIEGGDHIFSRMAARSAQAAALQGKFWEMHNKMFEGQKIWEQSQDAQTYYDQYAKELGLDMTKFEQDRKSAEANDVINADMKAFKDIGGTGTPTFVINGKKIDSPDNTAEAFSTMLDKALKDAGVSTNETNQGE